MLKHFFWLALVFSVCAACGDGDFRVNPTAGNRSNSSGGQTPATADQFFTQRLYPLMLASTGAKGCIGCHPPDETRPQYFQISAASAATSLLYANARKTTVTQGTYADEFSKTLQEQMEANHPNVGSGFGAWTDAEKERVTEWTNF
jgi:hypothetical protein